MYAPRPGSPVIDTGDPQDGSGADIGAIGAGATNPADRFGDFPAGSTTAVDTAEGGVPASSRRDSDGPLTLRCSTRPLGDSRDARDGGWLMFALALAMLRRSAPRVSLRWPGALAFAFENAHDHGEDGPTP